MSKLGSSSYFPLGVYTFDSLKKLAAEGRLHAPFGGEVAVDERSSALCLQWRQSRVNRSPEVGRNRYQVERAVDNIWDDIVGLGTTPGEDLGYPTQKTEALLERTPTTGKRPRLFVLTVLRLRHDACRGRKTGAAAGSPADANDGAIRRRRLPFCKALHRAIVLLIQLATDRTRTKA